MSSIIFTLILSFLCLGYIFNLVLDYLNEKAGSQKLPKEAEGIYDAEKYLTSQRYQKEHYRMGLITGLLGFLAIMVMLLFGGFAWLDEFVRSITENPIGMTLLFFGIIAIASDIMNIPFSLFEIFVIEEKYGFNKMTIKTYVTDKLKALLLILVIGIPLVSAIVWFYETTREDFWIYTWVVISGFSVLMAMFYTSLILPLFNKLKPLSEGGLRSAIEEYSRKAGFRLNNIFVMDGSKRSSKANAFFSGLGPKKKIVLFDTLIEKHSTGELVAVLAHEVGHYKKKHVFYSISVSVLTSGIMLFILSRVIDSPVLAQALGIQQPSFHIGILVFGMLYSPLELLLGLAMNRLSRKNEFEADAFAKATSDGNALMSALKKLSVDNLSTLTPHPLYVFFHYSHPTLLERLKALS